MPKETPLTHGMAACAEIVPYTMTDAEIEALVEDELGMDDMGDPI